MSALAVYPSPREAAQYVFESYVPNGMLRFRCSPDVYLQGVAAGGISGPQRGLRLSSFKTLPCRRRPTPRRDNHGDRVAVTDFATPEALRLRMSAVSSVPQIRKLMLVLR